MSDSLKFKQVYYKNNRLQQIRGFCNVVIYGSITEAAKKMGLSQSAISLQVKSLERDLKTKLFHRSKKDYRKRVELTREGREFYEISAPVVNATDNLYNQFFIGNTEYHNNLLRVVGHHSVFSILLPPSLKILKNRNPELKLKLSYLTRQEAFEEITKNEFDIGIYPIENVDSVPKELNCTRISNYKPALILPLNHPLELIPDINITFEEIGKYNYIHTGSYAISDVMNDNINSKILKSDIELNYGSWDMLEALVKAGLGVTIFHEDYIKDTTNLVIKRVYHLSPNIAYYAIYKKSAKIKKNVSELLKSILLNTVASSCK
jgi:DNA-binding transcriptional LysR family regulator